MDWLQLKTRLTIASARGQALPIPTRSEIEQFEKEAGWKLPRSYCEYMATFGAGVLADYFFIAAPLNKISIAGLSDLAALHEFWKGTLIWDNAIDGPFPYERLFYFAETLDSDTFAWLLGESADDSELPVYRILRHNRSPLKLTETFEEFVIDCILGPRQQETLDTIDTSPPSMTFEPAVEKTP